MIFLCDQLVCEVDSLAGEYDLLVLENVELNGQLVGICDELFNVQVVFNCVKCNFVVEINDLWVQIEVLQVVCGEL